MALTKEKQTSILCKYGNCQLIGTLGDYCLWHWLSIGQVWIDNYEEFLRWFNIEQERELSKASWRQRVLFLISPETFWGAVRGTVTRETLVKEMNLADKQRREESKEALAEWCKAEGLNSIADHKKYCRTVTMGEEEIKTPF